MAILGLILLLLGFFLAIKILWIIGLVLLIAGVVLLFVPNLVGGRRLY